MSIKLKKNDLLGVDIVFQLIKATEMSTSHK